MADEEAKEAQPRSDDNDASVCQSPITVIEILDSSNELVEETRQNVEMEEKTFIAGLYSHMRARGTPIERIPHLGFKQINLWMIFKAVEKLGGYDSVTTKRLWKKIYDELGGSPGSTSAATCTRKHYERLVLPYERHIKGEEEKPLPATKPRKPYKRNADGKVDKAEGKKPKSQRDLQLRMQRHDLVLHPLSSMWTVDKLDHSKHSSDSILPHVLPVSKTHTWTPPVPPGAGAGISPLEKKKRVAQASLSLQHSPQREERLSVILCSSPGPQASARASSDGSPQPQSSSSSRSPSPLKTLFWIREMAEILPEDDIDINQEEDEDSHEDVMTPAELIAKLEEAWLNEKFSPELLENKSEVVECVMEQLTHMEANLQRVKKGDAKASIHRMEIDRIRYVLSSYLRSRLQKIEKYFPHVLEKEKTREMGDSSLLSPEEFAFAKEYYDNTETYLKAVALKRMPPNLQTIDLLKAVPEPCLDSFVFLRVKERQENILVEPETDDQREYVLQGFFFGIPGDMILLRQSSISDTEPSRIMERDMCPIGGRIERVGYNVTSELRIQRCQNSAAETGKMEVTSSSRSSAQALVGIGSMAHSTGLLEIAVRLCLNQRKQLCPHVWVPILKPMRPCIRAQVPPETFSQSFLSFWNEFDDDDIDVFPLKNKRVMFADTKGLALADVRMFSDREEPSDLSILPSFQGLNLTEDSYSCTVSTCCPGTQLKLGFPQPSADFQAFRAKLEKSMVILENCSVSEQALQGTLRVKNICFQKDVHGMKPK
uniref:GINS complex subunit 4 n=1 Tax=Knipowitschia caucasica TaxID=637954 RepID=A0AAV2MSK5_KNICA